MSQFKTKINQYRRLLMRKLTKNTGRFQQKNIEIKTGEVKRIIIIRPNHRLGNLLMITPLVQEVINKFPQAEISLFVKGGIAESIFRTDPKIKTIETLPGQPFKNIGKYIYVWIKLFFSTYDLAINVISFSASGRMATKLVGAKYRFFGNPTQRHLPSCPKIRQQAQYAVVSFRLFLKDSGFPFTTEEIPLMNLKLQPKELEKGAELLLKITKNTNKTIAVFTYATGKKCFSQTFWQSFYETMRNRYSDYNIIEILPKENVSQINFKAPVLYSKDIREIASVIAQTDVFIGADSGIMHLASASLTPTIGLFSVTNLESFKPYGNHSRAIHAIDENFDECLCAIDQILNNNPLISLKAQ